MNMRKLLSIILAFVLVLGIFAPCFPVWGAEESQHQHTYGQWSFDTAKGTQSRTCSGCSAVQTLHGTTNKAEQVTEPAIGGQYYLAANVAGTLQYFMHGTVTNTTPNSLVVSDDAAKAQQITIEDPSAVAESTGVGFQMTYPNPNTSSSTKTLRIHCMGTGAAANTGAAAQATKGRTTFIVEEVGGVKVLRKTANNNILVVKYNTTRNEWRMLGVPESELANEGVYPAMLVVNHTHSYSANYTSDATKHWKACDCGAKKDEANHTYSAWSFDTANGTQSRACTACGHTELLHGTTNKATQVTAPAIGGKYYLAANVAGTLQYFTFGASTTNTTPYSLNVSSDTARATQITLEDPTNANEGTSAGFQMTFSGTNGALTRIYCYDVKTDGANRGVMDTGHNTANYKGRHTFEIAEVGGMKVLRKLSNNNILVVKYNTTRNEWRMLGVPASELGTQGVYPAMLVVNHTHSYGTTYEKDATAHWQICDCGAATPKTDHDYTNGPCVCGAELVPHDCQSADGKWYIEGNKHYQKCGTCNEKINEGEHAYGGWTFDTEKGEQHKLCTSCGNVGESLYGKNDKVAQVTAPTVGSTYYLAANVEGTLYSFLTNGGYTATSPYSIKTSTTLATVTLKAALQAGKGEFQLADADGKLIYSIDAGAGATTSVNYINDPARVSFLMDTVNGKTVIRAYGTRNILAVKYSAAAGAWRVFAVAESELANEGVYPVMLVNKHTHTPAATFEMDENQHWHACTGCGSKLDAANHSYVKDGTGNRVCECGKVAPPHDCQSADGKWFVEGNKHYQVCGVCLEKIQEGDHTPGAWIFDTAKGNQKKECSVCHHTVQILQGTSDKVEQAIQPAIGSKYYLVANVDGTLMYFRHGTVTNTVPNSLNTTLDVAGAQQITIEDPSAVAESTGVGFQMIYPNPNTSSEYKNLRIHCFGTAGAENTGAGSQSTAGRNTFFLDEVNGVKVLRKTGNNTVLVIKKVALTAGGEEWRMLGVAESELANEGVYPVILANLHTHTPGAAYEMDENQHWHVCASCEGKVDVEDHKYVKNGTDRVCKCGKVAPLHTCHSADGKWFIEDGKHYQVCGICLERIRVAEHTLSDWSFDTEKHSQRRSCTVCNHVIILQGKDHKVYEETAPAVGGTYYLVANVDGTLRYFAMEGSVADTKPYSLNVTDDLSNTNIKKITLETPISGTEGFQLSFIRESDNQTLRIYCYDADTTDPAMDTGINSGNELGKHTFVMDEVGGVKVLRKIGNDHVLAVKFNSATGTYRMLGVEESELANEGVYPAMLGTPHTHEESTGYRKDASYHWYYCGGCDSKLQLQKHTYVENKEGVRVCVCGQVMPKHTCKSEDGKWYAEAGKHYQLCGVCQERIKEADHTYGKWTFDTEKGTQTATCTVCKSTDTLHGTGTKGYEVVAPSVGGTYYLAANVDGKLYFFRHGTVTDTTPYSLWVTDDVNHDWVAPVTLEDPTATEEKITTGFQLTYVNPSNDTLSRIYCYDVLKDAEKAGQTGVMDTGVNSSEPYKNRHNFSVKVIGGQTVLSKTGNDNVLVVKYDPAVEAYRMLGVPVEELGKEGVYPAMLMLLHEHTHENETYHSDELGHWFACSCGGKSNYEDHVVTKWTYTKKPTQTTGGQKTGKCTVCGGKAVVEIPPMVADGYYYLTGKLGGTTYYFRPQTGTESVEDTTPFSLMSTAKEKEAMKVDVAWDEKSNTYVLSYTVTRTLNIYMDDVNGSRVQKDGKVDLAASATTDEVRILFRWDPAVKRFYQMENGQRYVIAFKKMTLTNGKSAVRMLAVPESELGGNVAPMQLQTVHIHALGDKWKGDAMNHWLECSCGMHKQESAHTVENWKVEKKATNSAAGRKSGVCTVCKLKVVNAIPMLTDKIKAPVNGGKYYLAGMLNGQMNYFRHTPVGGSVADTYPYSLYTDPGTDIVTPLTVKEKNGNYNLYYGEQRLHLYISGDGVGMTTQTDNSALVDFQWDKENKVLYQMESGVQYVLVFKMMRNSAGKDLVRITAMPLERALIDPTICIARLTTEAPSAEGPGLPEGATLLDEASGQKPGGEETGTGSVYESTKQGGSQMTKVYIAVAIVAVAVVLLILLLTVLRNGAFGVALFRRWNLWAGICIIAAGIVLVVAMLIPGLFAPEAPALEAFTIVANETSMQDAEALAVEIYEDHGISLPVVHCDDFDGDYGIFVNVSGFNSYGGYKYRITNEKDEDSAGVYIDGTGPALEVAISKWTKSLKKAPSFPFGMTEDVVGYEWNTGDVNMTGLGFNLQEMNSRDLYDGVQMVELKYDSFAYGKNNGYAVIIDADAPVELKVSAGEWDENTDPDNPGEKHTVQKHGKLLTDAGYEVIAISNAGFYDLNTTMTYIPWGMQIVDGLVKKAPNKDNPKNTDNWFAQTADGKYVISNTDGYYAEYETKLSDGVGGGLMLMENGKPCFTATTPDYRTVVGITKSGDLVMLTISGANYAVVTQAFMDMGLEMDCVLNLDGGGSTTLHALSEEGKLQQYICETSVEREVADAIAIVKKKD